MPNNLTVFLVLLVVLAFCLSDSGVHAFGAGNIPSFAYMEGKAFRHGDIEDALSELLKKGAAGGFGLASLISKGSKFGGLDVKRVYFGNWLRDYSQAVDIASLKKVNIQTIINLCMVLGFMAHGYATEEFEVTQERLGVYLPTEHIDNPKGYGNGEDPRQYHPGLRGPVDPRELEIDSRTGMKNYIANENGNWDTSKALVRRTLERCIHLGRQYRSTNNKADQYESFRLLGQALHTLEDFPAHSNFCELALVSQGYTQVFVHVGDRVRIQAPGGRIVPPIVTGSFGASDFLHSLLGEATDHLSEASVSDLNKELDNARSKSQSSSKSPFDNLRDLFLNLPGGSGNEMTREMEGIERIRAGPAQGGKRPEDMSPQELHSVLWKVLSFRDSVMKKISNTIEKIPGLGPLIEKISESISVFVFTTVEPFVKPILQTATSGLQLASGEVINSHDQYEVFNDPLASDPTHSFLSKDHFNLILNEPAGHLAKIILVYTVNAVVRAWDDTSINVNQVTEDILQCMFHPDFHNRNSKVQREMMQYMSTWVQELGYKRDEILQRLTREAVRTHRNIRLSGEGGTPQARGTFAYNEGVQAQQNIQGYVHSIPGVSQVQSLYNMVGGGPGGRREGPGESFSPPVTGSGYSAGSPSQSGIGGAPTFPGVSSPYAPPSGPNLSSYTPSSAYASPSSPLSFPGVARPESHGSAYALSYMNTGLGGRGPSFPGAHESTYHSNTTSPYTPPSRSTYTSSEGYGGMSFPSADVPSGGHGPRFPDTHGYGQGSEFRVPSPGRGNRHEFPQHQRGHQNQPHHQNQHHQHPHGGSHGDRW
ncbi:heterokaryon incompatibility protein Het-C-domain-containing protein [Scleroderma yunnanense]